MTTVNVWWIFCQNLINFCFFQTKIGWKSPQLLYFTFGNCSFCTGILWKMSRQFLRVTIRNSVWDFIEAMEVLWGWASFCYLYEFYLFNMKYHQNLPVLVLNMKVGGFLFYKHAGAKSFLERWISIVARKQYFSSPLILCDNCVWIELVGWIWKKRRHFILQARCTIARKNELVAYHLSILFFSKT